eukprot:jgi/Hompol1/2935/HPOL_003060-RA
MAHAPVSALVSAPTSASVGLSAIVASGPNASSRSISTALASTPAASALASPKPSSSNSTTTTTPSNGNGNKKKNVLFHLASGGIAGCCEALACHPLDTIKVRLQLSSGRKFNALSAEALPQKRKSFITVGRQIVQKEGFLSLYKGLGPVVAGIVPKMAIRFTSFEYYKELLAGVNANGKSATSAQIFLAGLGAGATESVLVVTPMDVIKIRLQAQRHSMADPLDIPKYRNAAHCAFVMIKEEGIASLYKGVTLTVLRQGTNQAANFTVYEFLKTRLQTMASKDSTSDKKTLPAWQTFLIGMISGACGPLFNAPIDTIKTRIQKAASTERGWTRFVNVTKGIIENEGYAAFYKGLVPRVLRVAPGQAVTFLVYERVYAWLSDLSQRLRLDDIDRAGLGKATADPSVQ